MLIKHWEKEGSFLSWISEHLHFPSTPISHRCGWCWVPRVMSHLWCLLEKWRSRRNLYQTFPSILIFNRVYCLWVSKPASLSPEGRVGWQNYRLDLHNISLASQSWSPDVCFEVSPFQIDVCLCISFFFKFFSNLKHFPTSSSKLVEAKTCCEVRAFPSIVLSAGVLSIY